LWKVLPERQTPSVDEPSPIVTPTSSTPVVTDRAGLTKATCEATKGHWVDCGSPCHGQHAEVCIEMCEPQCLCGGIAGWQCPANTICTDWEPGQQVPDAIGVCRTQASSMQVSSTQQVARSKPEGMICDETNSICVGQKYQEFTLKNPFVVTGTAIAFENQFAWELEDASGTALGKGALYASSSDVGQPGPFRLRAFVSALPKTTSGTLRLFEFSPRDGSPIHRLDLLVGFSQTIRLLKPY